MKTHLILFLLFFIWTSCGNSTKPSAPTSTDDDFEVLEERLPIADPYVLFYEDCYYAYGTNVRGFEVYTSTDLKHWHRNRNLALAPEDSWGNKGYWAPEVYYVESLKKFYMFYTVNEQVCVATSDSPEGPFVQDVKQPLFGSEKNIDPSLFIDSDGKAYLYFVRFTGGNVIWCAEMNSDLKSLKEETLTKCIEAQDEWERKQATVAEGPSILKQNGVYYLLYSANHFESKDYAVGYATSDSPSDLGRNIVEIPFSGEIWIRLRGCRVLAMVLLLSAKTEAINTYFMLMPVKRRYNLVLPISRILLSQIRG